LKGTHQAKPPLHIVPLQFASCSVGWSSPDYFTFMVMQTIVGSWDRQIGGGRNLSSAMCERVASEGLAHSFTSFNTCYNNTGIFGAYFVTGPNKVSEMARAVFQEWNRIGRNASARGTLSHIYLCIAYILIPLNNVCVLPEVERAKNRLKASILMSYDGSMQVAEDIGRQVLTLGRRMSPAEIFLRINAITPDDVRRVALAYCEDVEPAVASIGKLDDLPDYNWIRAWTYARET
jgi:processing peptidase subunit beta